MDVQTTINLMMDFYSDPLLQIKALIQLINLYGYSDSLKQVTNSSAEYQSVRFYALVGIATAVQSIEFTSSTDAQTLNLQISNIYEAELEFTQDAQLFDYLNNLQASTCSLISERGNGEPRLYKKTQKVVMPAVLWAYDLYQDETRTDEIILRNNEIVIHPLFMPTTLEVLTS